MSHRGNTHHPLTGVAKEGVFSIMPERFKLAHGVENDPTHVYRKMATLTAKGNEGQMILHIRANRNGMKLLKLPLTWESFQDGPYFAEIAAQMDVKQIAKYRAWWRLIHIICESPKQNHLKEHVLAAKLIARELAKRSYSKLMPITVPNGITQERIAKLENFVVSNLSDLAPH